MAADGTYDIVIAGGGMVGASLAVALGSLPLRVALVEALPFGAPGQPSFDARTVALSRSSQQILSGLGIWPALAEVTATIRRIHVSEQGRFGTALIDARQQGVPALGHVLENSLLGQALWQRLQEQPRLSLYAPARLGAVSRDDADCLQLALGTAAGPATLAARLLVVADGARSALRAGLGIDAKVRSYGQTAIVGNVAVSATADGETAYERFTAEGPLALLPAGRDRYAFVLTRRSEHGQAAMDMPDSEFLALLQRQFGFRLGYFDRLGQRSAYPLELTVASRVTARRAVLIGNAAHALHPVAAQGYNLGLRDVAALAEIIADGLAAGNKDPGAASLLAAWADWRAQDQRNVVAFTDGLIRLFARPGPGRARAAGLQLFDLLPPVKRGLARHTMGLAGRGTRLARGLPL